MNNNHTDIMVLGAGPAGLLFTANAAQNGRAVTVLDKAQRLGGKLFIAGGGRCNVTNCDCRPEHFISQNPHFCKSALAAFTPEHAIEWLDNNHILWRQRSDGRIVCRQPSAILAHRLAERCRAAGVRFLTGLEDFHLTHQHNTYHIHHKQNTWIARTLVIATGSPAWPQAGATDRGYQIARQLGLNVIPPAPALVPLCHDSQHKQQFADLSGLSLTATVSLQKTAFTNKVLFTHDGLSGPAILQISSYWSPHQTITIDWLPGIQLEEWLRQQRTKPHASLQAILRHQLPRRFLARWTRLYGIDKPLAQWPNNAIHAFAQAINHWQWLPARTRGYKRAEAARGGIDTDEISSKTMQAKRVPGLICIGEVLDVTGQLGGYNIHWAFASALAAARNQ